MIAINVAYHPQKDRKYKWDQKWASWNVTRVRIPKKILDVVSQFRITILNTDGNCNNWSAHTNWSDCDMLACLKQIMTTPLSVGALNRLVWFNSLNSRNTWTCKNLVFLTSKEFSTNFPIIHCIQCWGPIIKTHFMVFLLRSASPVGWLVACLAQQLPICYMKRLNLQSVRQNNINIAKPHHNLASNIWLKYTLTSLKPTLRNFGEILGRFPDPPAVLCWAFHQGREPSSTSDAARMNHDLLTSWLRWGSIL